MNEPIAPTSPSASSSATTSAPPKPRAYPSPDLLAALCGCEAERERAVANRTRSVVRSSLEVIAGQRAAGRRGRSLALAATLLVFLLLGPLVSWLVYLFFETDHPNSLANLFNLWICGLIPALLAAVVLMGWRRYKS